MSGLRWFHRVALTTIDKAIIAIALTIVSIDVSKGFSQIGWGLVFTMLVVFILYLVTVVIANIPNLFIGNKGRWTSLVMGGFTALMIYLLFPWLLETFFAIANFIGWIDYSPSVEIRTILLITFVLRAFLVGYMKRRWTA
jgi:hypothetical protein